MTQQAGLNLEAEQPPITATVAQNSPRLVLGLPVYNGEDYLRVALDSILAQTYTDFHLVIGDNASTDATSAICQEYAARDQRISYHRHQKNLGCGGNHNFVFQPNDATYFINPAIKENAFYSAA
ncbi:MAG: glycosyltransferase [Pegethrix bostrychoides GSE-TBD4-15B]|uniref:Glycosyltransferase n=1 Tax=Pegethrix bostrychoides GSE-TBD4-15B TaxID=2839662 RepID=A0A951PAE7_9CYAN|nr:glycosyltransferase [Pegethrix bostrychoides GSE-TBD4-15B]